MSPQPVAVAPIGKSKLSSQVRARHIFAWTLDRSAVVPALAGPLAELERGGELWVTCEGNPGGWLETTLWRTGHLVVSVDGESPAEAEQQARAVAARILGDRCPPLARQLALLTLLAPAGADAATRRSLAASVLEESGPVGERRQFLGDRVFLTDGPDQLTRVVLVGEGDQAERLGPPIALTLLQQARMDEVDRELAALRQAAPTDLVHVAASSWSTFRQRERLGQIEQRLHALALERELDRGPLTNPHRYFVSADAAALYGALVEALHLEEWAEEQDDLAEVVHDVYEPIAEKLAEYKNFLAEAVLEMFIIVVLIVELALLAIDLLRP